MRGAVGENEGYGFTLADPKIGHRGQILAAGLYRRSQHDHVGPADREQTGSVRVLLDPWDIRAEAEADHQLHPQLDPAADATDQPHHVGSVAARRHEVDQVDRAIGGLKPRLQDQRIVAVAARGFLDLSRRRDQPAAVFVAAEQCRKAGVGIECRPAQPVDRSVAPDQRRRLAIADQSVVFDPVRHGL